MAGFAALTLVAIGFDYFTRPQLPDASIESYGANAPLDFYAVVKMRRWQDYKNFKGVLIIRTQFPQRDRMSDDWIVKSVPYTIYDQNLTLVATAAEPMHFAMNAINTVEINFSIIPSNITPEQIRTLDDIAILGGKILATAAVGTSIHATPTSPDTASPSIHAPEASKQ